MVIDKLEQAELSRGHGGRGDSRSYRMSQASLIFIESNTSGTGRLFAQTAISLGYYPIVVSEGPERYPYLAQDNIETIQEKDVIETVERVWAASAR